MFALPFLHSPLVLSSTGAHPSLPPVCLMGGVRVAVGVKPSGEGMWIVSEVWIIPLALPVERGLSCRFPLFMVAVFLEVSRNPELVTPDPLLLRNTEFGSCELPVMLSSAEQ